MKPSRMISAVEISEELGVSQGYAYRLIRQMNAERREAGKLVLPRKIDRDYFKYRYFSIDDKAGASK